MVFERHVFNAYKVSDLVLCQFSTLRSGFMERNPGPHITRNCRYIQPQSQQRLTELKGANSLSCLSTSSYSCHLVSFAFKIYQSFFSFLFKKKCSLKFS